MAATARHAWALSLVSALLLNTATPAMAAERTGNDSTPAADLSSVMASAPVIPVTTALAPSALSQAVQRPISLPMPKNDEGVFASSSLRRSLYVSYGALQVLDAVSTRKALNAGAQEANPAMAGVAKNSGAMFAVKAGTAVATTFLAEKLAKKSPRGATILMAVLNGAYAAIVAHNYRVAGKKQ